jgi:Phage integrase family
MMLPTLPNDARDGESHIRLPRCLGLWAEAKRWSEKAWPKSERPNGEPGTKVLRLAETASRRIRSNGFGAFSRIVVSPGSEIWLSSRRQLIPCCTDKTCSVSLLGMCSVAMVQSVPLLRLRARGQCHQCDALSNTSTKALEKWITASGKKRADYLFPGRGVEGRHPMGQRQLNRLLKLWVVEAGLDPSDYSVESLRRTKALHILKGTGDLQTVRAERPRAFAVLRLNTVSYRTWSAPARGFRAA